ncbi:MAG: UPF0175 family protein, partial [Saprospiraceae bacterium]|nr:UPF0175 family protein [Saprospiraceae bacterium]
AELRLRSVAAIARSGFAKSGKNRQIAWKNSEKMTIELDDSTLAKAQTTEQEIKMLIAIALFKEEILTLGQAAACIGTSQK